MTGSTIGTGSSPARPGTQRAGTLARLLLATTMASAAPSALGIGPVAIAQQTKPHEMTERAERIIKTLRPAARSRYDDAAYANRIIQMEIPLPGRHGMKKVILNYNHSVDLAVYYDFDSFDITRETAEVLDDLGYALEASELEGSQYLIAGHTDAAGKEAYNQWLSESRALSAKRYLVKNFRIDPDRLIVVGFGETRLADRRRPRDGINRRVEITLIEDGYSGPTAERFEAPRATYHKGPAPSAEDLGLAEYGAAEASPTVADDCAGTEGIADPRPANTGLDDFGNRPTPVPCSDVSGEGTEPEPVAAEAPEPAPAPGADTATPAVSPPANPAADQNSAIGN
ncbi:OmpA family protein [Jiella avicenniae]|uniref:OmpA family protein n=1 Tax=Jiella avicenniae TaxID=2907202 RepID=A0A9X1P6T8_9HYPH|nr:OmpA family protein [Jiella avicenniae]MCE7030201.1 OmpA family protein [Jiella avicenniae]